ncbi:MAG: hypothetical protein N4A45_08655 [Flavobacteriales bacterium]|jgi:hypothetical protein|nr:hypothetical protein [Flavobacteriales bacterium]
MFDQKKELKRILSNLSKNKEEQMEYLNWLFKGGLHNVDELLLEFENSQYLWNIYGKKVFKLLSIDLDEKLNKINESGLHDLNDLSHPIWNEVRITAKNVLNEIALVEETK